jgi:hypothetical protein
MSLPPLIASYALSFARNGSGVHRRTALCSFSIPPEDLRIDEGVLSRQAAW